MSGSCPVGADVCRETAAERESLRRWKGEALPVLEYDNPEDAQARREAQAEVERLRAGIEALHFPVEIEPSETICGHCSWQLPNGRFFGQLVEWPCPTAALLNPTEGEN